MNPTLGSSARASGPIRNSDVVRVCSLAGIARAEEQLISLQQLKRGVEVSIGELEAARGRERITEKMFVVLSFTKATCDAFIGMAAELSELVPGAKPLADRVKSGYTMAGVAVDTTKRAVGGAKVDYAQAAATVARAAIDGVPESRMSTGSRFLARSTVIKSELVLNAVRGNADEVKKSAFEYGKELSTFTLVALKDATGSDGYGHAAQFLGLATEAFEYHQRLGEMFDQALAGSEETESRYMSQKVMFRQLAGRLQRRIDDLQTFLGSCANTLR